MRAKAKSASYLLRVKSMLGSVWGTSLGVKNLLIILKD